MTESSATLDAVDKRAVTIRRLPNRDGYRLETAQSLPYSREQVFEFFADAFQLEHRGQFELQKGR